MLPPPWSTILIKASRIVRYWNLQITKYNNKHVSNKTLQKAQEFRIIDFITNKEKATTCRATAKAVLKNVIPEANKVREEELKKKTDKAST